MVFRNPCTRRILMLSFGVWVATMELSSSRLAAAPPASVRPAQHPPKGHGEASPQPVVPGEKVRLALLELGSQRMAAGRFDEAIKAFSDVVLQHPTDPKPLYMRGECYRKMGRVKEAEADLRAAIKLDPNGKDEQMAIVMAELGAVLSDAGRAAEAIEVLEQAVKARPDMFESHYNLGVAHESLKHWPEAIAAYGRAIKLKPQDSNPRASQADAQYNLAVVYRRAGRLEEAVAPAREAVQLAPDRPHAHLNLGMLLSDTKRFDEAVGELMAAAQLADEQYRLSKVVEDREEARQVLHRAYWRLGVVQNRREQPAEAVAALEKAKALQSSPEVLTDLGLARRKKGDIVRAEAEFRAALAQNPKLHSARLHLASTLASTGRCDDAVRELALLPPDPQLVETTNRIKQRCDYDRQMKAREQAPK